MLITIKNIIGSIRNVLGIVTDGLKMWLPFERSEIVSSAQVAPDTSGNSNNATLYTGKALSFDGVNDYIDCGNIGVSLKTLAFWINLDSTTEKVLQVTSSQSVEVSSGTITLNGTWTGSTIYVDATATSTIIASSYKRVVITTTSAITVDDLELGRIGSSYGDFILSDLEIYDTPWTQADVTYDYNKPNHLVTDNPSTSIALSNLKGYFALSEGAGAIAYDSGTPLGSEAITNGDFSTDSDWSKGTSWTISGGSANCSFISTSPNLDQTALTIDKFYKVTLEVSGMTQGTLSVRLGGASGNQIININSNGTYTAYGTAGGATFRLRAQNSFDGSVDNVSVKEVSVGTINGATYVDQQTKIPQLGMMDWAKSTPVSDEIILIANPNNPSQDILGNSVRLREHSLNLDGSGYAEVADDSSLDMSSGFSVDFWVKLNSDERQWFVTKGTAANSDTGQSDKGFGTTILNNIIYATVNTSVAKYQVETTALTASGQWIYVCVSYEDNTTNGLKLYINQDSPIEKTVSGTIDETHNLVIGSNYLKGSFFASNQIDDVRFYNRPLSSEEVERNYKVGEVSHKAGSSFSDDFSGDYGN